MEVTIVHFIHSNNQSTVIKDVNVSVYMFIYMPIVASFKYLIN